MLAKGALRFLVAMLAASAVAVGAATLTPQQQAKAKAIGDQVYCLCGCVTTLNHCPHLESECSTKREMHALIAKDIQEGKSQPQILQDFVLKYGVKVLATPPPKGFNLTAWILPGVGLIAGLIVAVDIARRWHRPAPSVGTEAAVDPKVITAIEEEMKHTME